VSDVETLAELLKLQGTCEIHQTITNVGDLGSEETGQQLHVAMLRATGRAGQVLMRLLLADSWRYLVQARYEWRQLAPEEYVAVVRLEVADADVRPLARGTLEAVEDMVRAQLAGREASPPEGADRKPPTGGRNERRLSESRPGQDTPDAAPAQGCQRHA